MLRARYYDAAVGKWISEDPIGFAAGDSNLVRYVRNRAISSVDFNGLEELDLAIAQSAPKSSELKITKVALTTKDFRTGRIQGVPVQIIDVKTYSAYFLTDNTTPNRGKTNVDMPNYLTQYQRTEEYKKTKTVTQVRNILEKDYGQRSLMNLYFDGHRHGVRGGVSTSIGGISVDTFRYRDYELFRDRIRPGGGIFMGGCQCGADEYEMQLLANRSGAFVYGSTGSVWNQFGGWVSAAKIPGKNAPGDIPSGWEKTVPGTWYKYIPDPRYKLPTLRTR